MEVLVFNCRGAGSNALLGYSYHSSQYGLSLDNVAGFELVLPNGNVMDVTSKDKDLWFALRVSRRAHCRIGRR